MLRVSQVILFRGILHLQAFLRQSMTKVGDFYYIFTAEIVIVKGYNVIFFIKNGLLRTVY